jgi:hypothetical protein
MQEKLDTFSWVHVVEKSECVSLEASHPNYLVLLK